MKVRYNKNLKLYLRTQYQLNSGTKLGKSKKKNPKGCTEGGKFTTTTQRKENINKQGYAK